jgi:hypothetical protein
MIQNPTIWTMRKHGLWLCLICFIPAYAVSQQQASAVNQLPPVYLNHLYLVLDKQTYDDIGGSDFIRNQFAGFSQSTTVANGGASWTGTYIRGEHTYIELFAPFDSHKVGDAGIGFGVEQEGGVELIYNRLKSLVGEKAKKNLRIRKIDEKEIPWFYQVSVDYGDGSSGFGDWVMEYHRDFLKTRYPDAKPEEDGITRRQALLRSFKHDRYFEDIYEVTVALSDGQANQFVDELRAFGYKVKGHGGKRECAGADIKFVVIPRTSYSVGITKLRLRLLRPKEGQKIYRFGSKSVLKFDGKQATWSF